MQQINGYVMYVMWSCHLELLQLHEQYVATRFILVAEILANHIFIKRIPNECHSFAQYVTRKKY